MKFKDFLKFTLSHHFPSQYNKCVKIGKLHFCTRCLGLYPMMFLFIFLNFKININIFVESIILFLFPMPALLDWSISFVLKYNGYNIVRFISGILLGISMSRLIYLHILSPFNIISLVAFVLYSFFVFLIISLKAFIDLKNFNYYEY